MCMMIISMLTKSCPPRDTPDMFCSPNIGIVPHDAARLPRELSEHPRHVPGTRRLPPLILIKSIPLEAWLKPVDGENVHG